MAKCPEQSTQFCVVPRKSIKLLAESVGINYISSEAAGALAEDITYRIRQTVQSAISFVKHSKRDHLTGEDINRALLWSHVEPIYGYGSKNSNIFSSISTKDGDIFFHEDKEVNLRELTFSKGLSSLNELGDNSSKVTVEVTLLDKTVASTSQETGGTSAGSNTDSSLNFEVLSPALKTYYHQVTKNILHADENTVKEVLADLRNNSKVQIFLPFLVNFISTGMKLLVGNLEKVMRLLSVIKTLVDNKNLYLEPFVVQFVRAVMYCIVEKPAFLTVSTFDGWMLQNRATQLLCHIDRKCSNSGNYLHHQLLRTFKDILEDKERSLHSQYGAIVGLSMLGVDAVEQTVLSQLRAYAQHVESLRETNSIETITELNHVMDALKNCALFVFRSKLRAIASVSVKEGQSEYHKVQSNITGNETSHRSNFWEQTKWNKDIVTWYQDGYDFFGESFIMLAGNLEDFDNVVQSRANAPSNFSASKPHRQSANILYIRNLIKQAFDSAVKRDPAAISSFSVPVKRRRMNEISSESNFITDERTASACKLEFLNTHDSEIRFRDLVEKNFTYWKKTSYWKAYVGKRRHQSLFTRRKSFFSLSAPL